MLLHRNQPSSSPPDALPVAGLVRTHWVLSVCVVCGHERPHGERHRATCPTWPSPWEAVPSRKLVSRNIVVVDPDHARRVGLRPTRAGVGCTPTDSGL